MSADHVQAPAPPADLAERLERGELIYHPVCPFPLPAEADRAFLARQRVAVAAHKNISYDPAGGRLAGFARRSEEQAERLRQVLASFSRSVTAWLGEQLPRYRERWQPDRASYRPLEEATRHLRPHARNDLLHIDTFPTRPSQGWRILRVFVNVNPTEPRVWVTSETFAHLLAHYGRAAGLPGRGGWAARVLRAFPRLLGARRPARSPYDGFMLRFHHFLKSCDDFQDRAAKRVWGFAPGSMWMAMTDGVSHAALRGSHALEHSYFIAPETLALPGESPAALLARACARLTRAA